MQDHSSNPRKSGKWYGRRFMPTTLGTFYPSMTSKALLSQCELEYVGEVETITVNGKKKIVLHRPSGGEEEGGEG